MFINKNIEGCEVTSYSEAQLDIHYLHGDTARNVDNIYGKIRAQVVVAN